jgi:hypothetical protein
VKIFGKDITEIHNELYYAFYYHADHNLRYDIPNAYAIFALSFHEACVFTGIFSVLYVSLFSPINPAYVYSSSIFILGAINYKIFYLSKRYKAIIAKKKNTADHKGYENRIRRIGGFIAWLFIVGGLLFAVKDRIHY